MWWGLYRCVWWQTGWHRLYRCVCWQAVWHRLYRCVCWQTVWHRLYHCVWCLYCCVWWQTGWHRLYPCVWWQTVWERWSLDDSGRAELPLTESYDETFPIGMAIDFTSQRDIPLGERLVRTCSACNVKAGGFCGDFWWLDADRCVLERFVLLWCCRRQSDKSARPYPPAPLHRACVVVVL